MKMTRLVWITLAAAGCGPAATHAPVTNSSSPHAAVQHQAPTPCPDPANVVALASWGKTTGTADASCVALWSEGHSVWLFDGYWEPPEGENDYQIGMWTSLTGDDGKVLWADGSDDLPPGAMDSTGTSGYAAVDFDGDGSDEVVFEVDYDHGGYSESSISAGAIRDGKLQVGKSLPLSSDNSAADEDPSDVHTCDGKYEVIDGPDGTKQVAITGSGESGDECALAGRHVYRWNGTTLIEATGP